MSNFFVGLAVFCITVIGSLFAIPYFVDWNSYRGVFEDEATRETLKAAIRTLPERDQVIVALYFFEGFTLAEIGEVLDVTESRVSQLRTRALKALREELAASLRG